MVPVTGGTSGVFLCWRDTNCLCLGVIQALNSIIVTQSGLEGWTLVTPQTTNSFLAACLHGDSPGLIACIGTRVPC